MYVWYPDGLTLYRVATLVVPEYPQDAFSLPDELPVLSAAAGKPPYLPRNAALCRESTLAFRRTLFPA